MKLACFYILKKRLNGVFDRNIGLIIQRFPNLIINPIQLTP